MPTWYGKIAGAAKVKSIYRRRSLIFDLIEPRLCKISPFILNMRSHPYYSQFISELHCSFMSKSSFTGCTEIFHVWNTPWRSSRSSRPYMTTDLSKLTLSSKYDFEGECRLTHWNHEIWVSICHSFARRKNVRAGKCADACFLMTNSSDFNEKIEQQDQNGQETQNV